MGEEETPIPYLSLLPGQREPASHLRRRNDFLYYPDRGNLHLTFGGGMIFK
jgi:hypothetical protein